MIELYLENKVGAFMKKRSILLIILMIGMFMLTKNVYAEEDRTCNAVSLNELRTAAANVKVSYVPGAGTISGGTGGSEYGDGIEDNMVVDAKYLDVKIYNVTEKLFVRVNVRGNRVVDDEKVLTYRHIAPDGSITIRQPSQSELMTYTFTVFSDSYGCTNRILRTIKLTLPRFNYYSQLSMCQDIPEYYLCQEYTTYKVDGSTFYDKVDEYKAKLLAQEEDKNGIDLDDNTGVISKTLTAVSNHKFVVVGIVVLIGVIVTIVILRRKKSDL